MLKRQSTNRKWYGVWPFNSINCDDLGCMSRSLIDCKLFSIVAQSLCHSRASCQDFRVLNWPTFWLHGSFSPTHTILLWSCSSDFPLYWLQCTVSIQLPFIAALLQLAGDIEYHAGPATPTTDQLFKHVNIGILNCRSAVNKMALLHD